MKSSTSKGTETREFNYREIDWELRPGGMLVQKRDVGVGSSGPMIKIKVSHGSCHYDTDVPAQSTFGDLKKVLANETGLEPKEQRLLFRGKERENDEYLHMVGVKDMSKVILFEDPASKERKLEEMKRNQGTFEAYEAVSRVRAEVDKLCEKVVALETTFCSGTAIADKEFVVLTELLMIQLLKLDSIEANGEAKVQRRIEKSVFGVGLKDACSSCAQKLKVIYPIRKTMLESGINFILINHAFPLPLNIKDKEGELESVKRIVLADESIVAPLFLKRKGKQEVRRIQSFVDTLDNLKARNSNPFSNSSNAVSVTTKWETFASGVGSLSAPVPIQSATKHLMLFWSPSAVFAEKWRGLFRTASIAVHMAFLIIDEQLVSSHPFAFLYMEELCLGSIAGTIFKFLV
ncbi:BAG family molecular chaperone regulator 4-like [Populus alba x Populus x berolinensis]|uniref:BAG family molecular chaperone regulator 4-like n=1 Tax=Populus alba x Populus x berolinensis TaxID=444605 RepID=A0AAD6MGD2_9ROSI|nr:BAG family molecular chaperone regulator 4-like [Populus alba x Populus x berolinensis]